MKTNYFHQDKPDNDDYALQMAIAQSYVPLGCLLGGPVVIAEVQAGRNPCWGCNGPRLRCGGKPKREAA